MGGRIIIDLTDIWLHLARNQRVTGIQRVVLKIAKHLHTQDRIQVLLGYYDPRFGIYSHFVVKADLDNLAALRAATQARYVSPYRPYKFTGRPVARFFQYLRKRALPALRRLVYSRAAKPAPLDFEEGDIVLSLGCGWSAPDMFRLMEPLARTGAVTPIVLIHDMTPLLGDSWRTDRRKTNFFHLWLSDISRYAGNFLAYSESTRLDLDAYLAEFGAGNHRIEKVTLAHEFQIGDPEPVSDKITSLARQEYVLAVISHALDNKNLKGLLEAWSRLCTDCGHAAIPCLMIAGGIEHANLPGAVVDHLGDRLAIVSRPNDSELALLYESALFTVLPSTYEGWGLPIGESLWHGKFCITSNVASMPEVGGPFCDYFDPHDVDNMVEVLKKPILDRDYLREREAAIDRSALITWDQSAEILLEAVMRIAGDRN